MYVDEETRSIEVLLVEDNPGDVRLMREAFWEVDVRHCLHTVPDGVQAIDFLRRREGHERAPRPDLIVLDLNLPRKGGREVLSEIKADPRLRKIPVVVLSSSTSDDDVTAAYDLHANCYVSKPVDFDHFVQVVRSIEHFWFGTARLPALATA